MIVRQSLVLKTRFVLPEPRQFLFGQTYINWAGLNWISLELGVSQSNTTSASSLVNKVEIHLLFSGFDRNGVLFSIIVVRFKLHLRLEGAIRRTFAWFLNKTMDFLMATSQQLLKSALPIFLLPQRLRMGFKRFKANFSQSYNRFINLNFWNHTFLLPFPIKVGSAEPENISAYNQWPLIALKLLIFNAPKHHFNGASIRINALFLFLINLW
jgi:hypothetical protein